MYVAMLKVCILASTKIHPKAIYSGVSSGLL